MESAGAECRLLCHPEARGPGSLWRNGGAVNPATRSIRPRHPGVVSLPKHHPYSERLAEAAIEPSVGSRGDSYDDALAETINGLYKAEEIHRRTAWKTRESVELATLEWVACFNHHRLMEHLGYTRPPKLRQTTIGSFKCLPLNRY